MPSCPAYPAPNNWAEERRYEQPPPGASLGPEKDARPVPAGECYPLSCTDGALCPPPDSASGVKVEPSTQLSPDKAGGPEKKARKRTYFTQDQLMALHQRFQNQHYMNVPQTQQLAKDLNLTYQQVKTWFQNRRMKHKKNHKESLWAIQGSRLLPAGSQPGEHIGTSPFSQGFQAHPGGALQRCVGHPYQNHARMQSQGLLQEDRPMGLQRQRILQSQGPLQEDRPMVLQRQRILQSQGPLKEDRPMGLQRQRILQSQGPLQEDRPMALQRQRILQSLGPQQAMDMFQNYQVMEYQSSRQADGYNFTPPLSYPSGTPCQQYYYQQHQQLHCNHYQSMPHRKYESTEQKEPQGYQTTFI